jgi:hypothetical protein
MIVSLTRQRLEHKYEFGRPRWSPVPVVLNTFESIGWVFGRGAEREGFRSVYAYREGARGRKAARAWGQGVLVYKGEGGSEEVVRIDGETSLVRVCVLVLVAGVDAGADWGGLGAEGVVPDGGVARSV